MPEKFLNKYRIPSARLQDWDYKNAGAYFITICTHNREHYFGEIEDEKMYLSPIGKIVETEWLKTPTIRRDMNLELDEFVVMPNHFHGILIIGENEFNKTTHPTTISTKNKFGPQSKNLGSVIRGFKSSVTKQVKMYGDGGGDYYRDGHFDGDYNRTGTTHGIGTHGRDAMHGVSTIPRSTPESPTARTLLTAPFAWQPRFHDHIIRDAESFDRIRQYIANNPFNWKEDRFYGGK